MPKLKRTATASPQSTPRRKKGRTTRRASQSSSDSGNGETEVGSVTTGRSVLKGSSAPSGDASKRGKEGRRSHDEEEDLAGYIFENYENFRSPDNSNFRRRNEGEAGIHSPVQQDNPMTALKAEMTLYRVLKEKHILIDTFSQLPKRVFFVRGDEGMVEAHKGSYKPLDTEDYFSIVYKEGARRRSRNHVPLVDVVLKHFENLKHVLQFDDVLEEWTALDDACYMVVDQTATLVHHLLATIYRDGQFTRAFVKCMSNGAGKVTLRAFLNMAMMACFGDKAYQKQYAWCNIIGQGPEETEKFRIDLTPSAVYHVGANSRELRSNTPSASEKVKLWDDSGTGKVQHSPRPSTSHADDEGNPGSVRSSQTKSSLSFVKISGHGVYADVVGISGCDPNWPHYLIMGEVKSKSEEPTFLSIRAKSQLVREMLGALSHQSYVGGILLGHREACLAAMEIDFVERLIYVTFRSYDFVCEDGKTFNVEEIQQLFKDVVTLFICSQRITKGVRHKYASVGANVKI